MSYITELREVVGSRPLIMAGATVVLMNDQQQILLQKRADNHCWGLPGGSMELGETLEQVAKRELEEETGLVAVHLQLLDIFSGPELYYQYLHGDEVYNVVAAYVCREYSGSLQAQCSEVQELQFFDLFDLPQMINPPDLPIVQYFLKSFLGNHDHPMIERKPND
ncbi:NUDIX hydrolase [Paenibacillus sp. KACC 21273]|uniref:NUDIX hydrolase n=1 Tax=Paenibacillus sp. KACC 21273 TaxID=3025665 RepID=UPI0023672133|nr:NUDIX hydrolase [Paenibacillus sp. KACC 21273]WDF49747.1 NUDIX hydrolase [Paenibacillus sp. KACC 21273]